MTDPFFSICIPAYNCGQEIYSALRSVANQSFRDWEVVVANDGSTDDTAEVCRYQKIIPANRYLFLDTTHSGLLDTRRELLEASRGEVVISLDADDFLFRDDALMKIYKAFSDTKCDFVMFNATRHLESPNHNFVDYSSLQCDDEGLVDIVKARKIFSQTYDLNNVAFKAYRKYLLILKKTPRPIQMVEDRMQSAQLFLNGKTCSLIDEPLYYYKPNMSSITKRNFDCAYVADQLYVEDCVDKLRDQFGLSRKDGDMLMVSVVSHDLNLVRASTVRLRDRIESYRKILNIWNSSSRANVDIDSRIRIDRRITFNLLLRPSFYLLDLFLGVLVVARRIVKGERK